MLPECKHFTSLAYCSWIINPTITVSVASLSACPSGRIWTCSGRHGSPKRRRIRHIAGQCEILIPEGLCRSDPSAVFCAHRPKLRCTDERLAREHPADKQAEDDEHDGELDKGEARLLAH